MHQTYKNMLLVPYIFEQGSPIPRPSVCDNGHRKPQRHLIAVLPGVNHPGVGRRTQLRFKEALSGWRVTNSPAARDDMVQKLFMNNFLLQFTFQQLNKVPSYYRARPEVHHFGIFGIVPVAQRYLVGCFFRKFIDRINQCLKVVLVIG